MATSSWHVPSLLGFVAITLAADAGTPEHRPGIVVLHFAPSAPDEAERACRPEVKNDGRERTLFRDYRTADGTLLTISGHVALRFKASTSEAQIDSLIAATGIEAFPAGTRFACRRYVFSVARLEDDPSTIASTLQASGLVDYAVPDESAGRPEGSPGDSFYVDQVALSASMRKNDVTADTAPSKYGMGQVLSAYTGPVTRVDRAEMSAAMFAPTGAMSALDLVKSHGLTTLRVDVPRRSEVASVRIMLYTLTGTPVRQLVSESLDPGQYLVGWDGLDDRGRRVQPGVYVAVMTAGDFHENRRLVVR